MNEPAIPAVSGMPAGREEEDTARVRGEEADRRAQIAARLDRLFRHAGDEPETRALYRVILEYRLGSGG